MSESKGFKTSEGKTSIGVIISMVLVLMSATLDQLLGSNLITNGTTLAIMTAALAVLTTLGFGVGRIVRTGKEAESQTQLKLGAMQLKALELKAMEPGLGKSSIRAPIPSSTHPLLDGEPDTAKPLSGPATPNGKLQD